MIFVWIYIGIAVLWLRPIFRHIVVNADKESMWHFSIKDGTDLVFCLLMTMYGAALWPVILAYICMHKVGHALSGGDFYKLALRMAGQGKEAKQLSYDELLQRNKELEEELKVGP